MYVTLIVNSSTIPCRKLAGFFSLLIFASPLTRAAEAPTSDNAAAILAITPRTKLPPAAEDPLRPPNTRQLKPDRWTDDVGIDDNGYIYNLYWRASTGVWSNYDEAKANPYPLLPDPLVLKNGQPVKDADTWWKQRRPEILSDFLTEIYGRIPENTPKITWEVTAVNERGGVRTKTIVGHIDNSAYPDATPTINLTLSLPANASGPVPVMVIVSPSSAAPPDWSPSARSGPLLGLAFPIPAPHVPTLRHAVSPPLVPCSRFSPGAGAAACSTPSACRRTARPPEPRASSAW